MRIKLLCIITLLLISCNAWGANVTVCDSGCDYATVALALAGVSNGNHTITVTGTYTKEAAFTISTHGDGVGTELTIVADGTQSLPAVTISGYYVKIDGFTFTSAGVIDSGHHNIIDGNTFKGRQGDDAYVYYCSTCYNSTFQNNTIDHWWDDVQVMTGNTSHDVLIYNNTFNKACSSSDTFRIFGYNQIIRSNTVLHPSTYGTIRANGETLELGECRIAASLTHTYDSLWEVTTAGTTAGSEPDGFETTGKSEGDTLADGTVTWTLRDHTGQHCDFIQFYGDPTGSTDITVAVSKDNLYEKNKFINDRYGATYVGSDGSYGCQFMNTTSDGSAEIKDNVFRNNIVAASRAGSIAFPGSSFYSNTFIDNYQSPTGSNDSIRSGLANNQTIINNIYYGCGSIETNGWYGGYGLPRSNTETIASNVRFTYPSTGHDGYHGWRNYTLCTTGGSEPADFTIAEYNFTGDLTAGSTTIANVSTFDNIQYYAIFQNQAYIDNRCYIEDFNTSASTVTLTCSSSSGPAYNVKQTAEGVSLKAIRQGQANAPVQDLIGGTSTDKYGHFDNATDVNQWTASNASHEIEASGRYHTAVKITATDNSGKIYYTVTGLTASTNYALLFYYKNTAGDTAQYAIYDVSNSGDIVAATDLANSTSWSSWQKINFTTPAGCTSIRIDLIAKSNGDIVWFDSVALKPRSYNYSYARESVKVTDGTCVFFMQETGASPTASNNYVADVDNSAKTGFEGCTGCVSGGNPYFTDYANKDYTLTENSTILIGVGTQLNTSFTDDYAGTTRGILWDIGAYEYEAGAILYPSVSIGSGSVMSIGSGATATLY